MGNFYSESNNKLTSIVHSSFYTLFRTFSSLAKKAKNAGEIADYSLWVNSKFPGVEFFSTREKLWGKMRDFLPSTPITVVELGVAWGYTTDWWLGRNKDTNFQWHGFDLFTGLPSKWRGLDEGHFDAQGSPPQIEDSRVTWHIGYVEETINELNSDELSTTRCVIFFDLDLFEPSLKAWEFLKDFLKNGDLLYFDEAFDDGERKLLEDFILPEFEVKAIGNTPLSLTIQILNRKL